MASTVALILNQPRKLSKLGHLRRFSHVREMSAASLIATEKADIVTAAAPSSGMSAWGKIDLSV